jgi:hypothetical protein
MSMRIKTLAAVLALVLSAESKMDAPPRMLPPSNACVDSSNNSGRYNSGRAASEGRLPVLRESYVPCTFGADTAARPLVWLSVFERDTASFARRAAALDAPASERFANA